MQPMALFRQPHTLYLDELEAWAHFSECNIIAYKMNLIAALLPLPAGTPGMSCRRLVRGRFAAAALFIALMPFMPLTIPVAQALPG